MIQSNIWNFKDVAVLCWVGRSCLTLCEPLDCSPPGSSVHGDSPGKNTGVDCHALLQGIFPTQGLNPGFPQYRQILYHLSNQGNFHQMFQGPSSYRDLWQKMIVLLNLISDSLKLTEPLSLKENVIFLCIQEANMRISIQK